MTKQRSIPVLFLTPICPTRRKNSGKSDPGETIEAASTHVIREETGLDVEIGLVLGAAESALPDRRVIYLFFQAAAASATVRLSEEHDQFAWASLDEMPEHNLSPQFRPLVEAIVRSHSQPVLVVPELRPD